MIEAVLSSPFFGMVLCLASYLLGLWIRKKTNWTLANPLLIAVAVSISVLVLLDIPYESFAKGADVINWMLGPVTVLLALGNLSFWLFDRALISVTRLYRLRIRPKLKKMF